MIAGGYAAQIGAISSGNLAKMGSSRQVFVRHNVIASSVQARGPFASSSDRCGKCRHAES
jgi:hypothetical protein